MYRHFFNRRPGLAWAALLALVAGLGFTPASFADSDSDSDSDAGSLKLGMVDVLSGPGSAAGQARLADLEEAVRRFELFNPDARVKVRKVDLAKNKPEKKLHQLDGAVFGESAQLDAWVGDGVVFLADAIFRDDATDSLAALLDTATAFVGGSAGVAVTSGGPSSVDALLFTPPSISSLNPPEVVQGDMLAVYIDNLGFVGDQGFFEADVGSQPAVVTGPYIDFTNWQVVAMSMAAPFDGESGPVRLSIPSAGTPSVNRELVSPMDLQVMPRKIPDEEPIPPPPPPPPPPTPSPQPCDVTFHRLGSPNFFSELADSKDVVVAQFDTDDNLLDVFVPQTLIAGQSHNETLYKNLGNDGAGLPNFATITNILTNDVFTKRQYGATAGDLDGDGDLDVVPSGETNQAAADRVRLLINNNNLSFTNEGQARITNYASVSGSQHGWDETALADIDGDGDLDVGLSNRDGVGRSALLLNLGSFPGDSAEGTFTAYPNIFNEPTNEVHHDIAFCDIDDDGFPDVVLSQNWEGPNAPVRLYINQHNGNPASDIPPTFVDATAQISGNPNTTHEHVNCRDFDNNGLIDIHAGVWDSPSTDLIFLNTSADTNGNGNIDINEIVLTAVADPDPTSPAGTGFKANMYSGAYGDFNNDTYVDIVLGSNSGAGSKGPFLMCNNGNGTFTRVGALQQYWRDLSNTGFDHFNTTSPDVGDFNGDGLLDVVFGMGDTMNGPIEEVNRIYIQETGSGGGGGGGGGGGPSCLQLAEALAEPCHQPEIAFEGLQVDAFEGVQLSPLTGLCRGAMDCGQCGDRFLGCEKNVNLVFDFGAAGLSPKAVELDIIDFAGDPVGAKVEDQGGLKIVSFVPRGEFREGGLDQELLIQVRFLAGGADAVVPVSFQLTDEALAK